MNYYRRYSGDYLRDTSKLSMLEHGAYCLMLDYYYSEEVPLPLEKDEIYTMVRAMTPDQRKAVDKVLARYFERGEDGYHNNRADEEIATAQSVIDTARKNGTRGGRPRRNPDHNPDHNPEKTRDATSTQTHNETRSITRNEPANNQPPTSNLQPPTPNPQPPSSNHQPGGKASMVEMRPQAQIAVALRTLGVKGVNGSHHPTIQRWVDDGFSLQQVTDAAAVAINERGKTTPSLNYLDAIVRDPNRKRSADSVIAEAHRLTFGSEKDVTP